MQKELVKVNAIALNANCFDTKSYLHGSQPHLYDEDGVLHLLEDCELLQFTGLYDKNGQEIYEGDTISYGGVIYIVEYNENDAGFLLKNMESCWHDLDIEVARESKVIGNVYKDGDLNASWQI